MTWTYTGNPSSSDRDAVRFLIGDTDNTDQLVTDEEIAYLLTSNSVNGAAIQACRTIAAKFARMADKAVGDLRLSASQKHAHYLALANTLKTQSAIKSGAIYSGGISKADKQANENDTDRVAPPFSMDQFDVPGVYNGDVS